MHSGAQTPMHAWGSQTPSHPGSMTPSRAPMTPGRECAFISHLFLRRRLLAAHRETGTRRCTCCSASQTLQWFARP